MSRPTNLPPSLQAWATGTYGAGPSWGGTPQRAAPGAAFLTPGVTLPAEVGNYLHGNGFDAIQNLMNYVGQLPVNNWPNVQTTDLSAGPKNWANGDSAFDTKRSIWFSILHDAAAGDRVYSSRNGIAWAAVGAAFSTAGASGSVGTAVYDPSADRYYVTNVGQIADYNATAATWTTAIVTVANALFSTSQWFASKGVFIGNITTTKLGTYTNAAGWTTRTAPANVAAYNFTWRSAQGAGIILACPDRTGSNTYVLTTSDGITWAEYQFATLAGETIVDVAFGDGVFVVAVATATDTKIYQSSTGLTASWTLVATLTGTLLQSLGSMGALFLGTFGSAATRGMYSADKGVTWKEAQGMGDRLAAQAWRVFSNGNQFLVKTLVGTAAAAATSMGSFIMT